MKNNRSITGYVLLGLSLGIVFYYNYQRAQDHMRSAWGAIGEMVANIITYGIVIVIGLAGILFIYSSRIAKRNLILVIYLLGIGAAFCYLHVKTTESSVPVYLEATGGGFVLKLRKDSSFRVINYNYHMAESWQEGDYSLQGNKITLTCKEQLEGGLGRELWIRRDTIFYGNADSDTTRVKEGRYLAIDK